MKELSIPLEDQEKHELDLVIKNDDQTIDEKNPKKAHRKNPTSLINPNLENDFESPKLSPKSDDKPKNDSSRTNEIVCRICLSPEEEEEDPLISPCKCKGSMSSIHYECLKTWLHGKVHYKETERVNSYNWKFLECELCKTRLKDMFIHKGKELHVLQYLRPDSGHYMVLESFTNTPHKTMHVIKLDREDNSPSMAFKIG